MTRFAHTTWSRCVALVALVAACTGAEGTMAVSVVTAPQSTIMDSVVTVRLTLSDPMTVVEATRDASGGFSLALDVSAQGQNSALTFEGFSQSDELVAYGRTPLLPMAAIDAVIAVYVAPPLSIEQAPVVLEPARADMGVVGLPFGPLMAGGRYASGDVAGDVIIYNAYTHALQPGLDLPAPRARPVLMAGALGTVYIFAGTDAQGQPTATAWAFDTSVPPAGIYSEFAAPDSNLARDSGQAAPRSQETFVVTGDPLVVVDGVNRSVTEYAGAPALDGTATTAITDNVAYTLFAGAGSGTSGAVLLVGDEFMALDAPAATARTDHRTVARSDATMVVVGGEINGDVGGELVTSAVTVDALTATAVEQADMLATPRRDPAVAITDAYLLVAGGQDASGQVMGDAELFDAATLQPVTTLPLRVPRKNAWAVALGNGQILIAGGTDAADQPIDVMELFTPAP